MAGEGLEFSVSGSAELDEIVRELGEVAKRLPSQFLKVLREEAQKLADEAARKALAIRAKGEEGSTGLRAEVAKGVSVKLMGRAGVRIQTKMPEESEAIIPRGFDTRRGWRHPVFGRRNQWVRQPGSETSWFMDTMQDGNEPITERLHDLLESAARDIADQGF